MRNEVISLVAVTYTTDAIGQKTPKETSRDVFCKVESVSQSEWFEAGRSGLKAEYRATVSLDDYQGEEIAVYNGSRYGVYRTYRKDPSEIELYLEKKGGI